MSRRVVTRSTSPNQTPYSAKLMDRLVGIMWFDDRAFDAVRHDPAATRQALVMVVLTGLGGVMDQRDHPLVWQVATPLLSVAVWVISAWLVALSGTRLLGAPAPAGDWIQLLRLLGFVPIISVAGVTHPVAMPVPERYLFYLLLLWGAIVMVKAVKLALGVGTGRAIAASLLAELSVATLVFAVYVTFRHWGLA